MMGRFARLGEANAAGPLNVSTVRILPFEARRVSCKAVCCAKGQFCVMNASAPSGLRTGQIPELIGCIPLAPFWEHQSPPQKDRHVHHSRTRSCVSIPVLVLVPVDTPWGLVQTGSGR